MRKFIASAAAAACLSFASTAGAVDLTFSFSTDLLDPYLINATAGTVTGRILGLTDNATSAATQVFVDSCPALVCPTLSGPEDVTAWQTQFQNSFTLADGVLVGGSFRAGHHDGGELDQFFFNVSLGYVSGATNYVAIDNDNGFSVWNNNGLAGINLGSAAPEPAAWALMIGGFGFAGAALRRRTAVAHRRQSAH